MKKKLLIFPLFLFTLFLSSCKDEEPRWREDMEHHYYVHFNPWNNTKQTIKKNAEPVELEVQFESAFTRDYNAEVSLFVKSVQLVSGGIVTAEPAVYGTDFVVTDEKGTELTVSSGAIKITFEQAKKQVKKFYVKPLNNSAATGSVYVRLDFTPGNADATDLETLINTETTQYTVSGTSQSYSRPIQINP